MIIYHIVEIFELNEPRPKTWKDTHYDYALCFKSAISFVRSKKNLKKIVVFERVRNPNVFKLPSNKSQDQHFWEIINPEHGKCS